MRTHLASWGTWTTTLLLVALALTTTSCGGGGIAAKDMILVELQFLDRALTPTAPTGTESLPRNARIGLLFSERVDPSSINDQTIRLRFGPSFASVPIGSFQVNGNTVLFDPTVSSQGQPHPTGLEPVTQYSLSVPGFGEQTAVVRNLDRDPNLSTFLTQFTTSAGWLRELVPPRIEGIVFAPDVDELTGNVAGNSLMGLRFSEPMDPQRFLQGAANEGTVDIRYTDAPINDSNDVALTEIVGSFIPSPDFRTFWFRPIFSWGDAKLVFTASVTQGLTDLSGNGLLNPSSFGPFTCDGQGIATGKVIREEFLDQDDMAGGATDADWGLSEEGTLVGLPVTSREVLIYSYVEADNGADSGRGQYAPLVDPLIGATFNQVVPNPSPPTADGRRVLWAFPATKIGARGTITGAAWGPDSNATFAALYPHVKLRAGYQKQDQLSLSPSFEGNYAGQPAVLYSGSYSVQQMKDVGNTPGEPLIPYKGTPPSPGACNGDPSTINMGWNAPLFDYTGWYDWPALTTFFEWNPEGDPNSSKRVLLFDASVQEGDQFQQSRGWFGATSPCSGFLIGGLPLARMRAEYEGEAPNPENNVSLGIQNPEQSLSDVAFTLTRRMSQGQSRFFTPDGTDNTTFGIGTDYRPAVISPAVQANGAQVVIEYQGADAIDVAPGGLEIVVPTGNYTQDLEGNPSWVQDVNLCDGMANIRFRVTLISNLVNNEVGRVTRVLLPMTPQP